MLTNMGRLAQPVHIVEVETPHGVSDREVEQQAENIKAALQAVRVYPLTTQKGGTTKFCVVLEDLISEPFKPGTLSGAETFELAGLQDGWVPVGYDDLGEVLELPIYTSKQGGTRILIAGSSGTGKSTVPNNILASCLRAGNYEVWLADPQLQTFGAYAPFCDRVASTVEEIVDMICELDQLKDQRVDEYQRMGFDNYNAEAQGRPIVLILEELSAMTDTNPDKKSQVRFEKAFTSLAQRARKAGITLVVSMQVSSADTIPSRARSQFDIRIAHQLAQVSDTAMILPSLPEDAPQPHELGGRITRDGMRTTAGLFVVGGESVDRARLARGWHINKQKFVENYLAPNGNSEVRTLNVLTKEV